MSDATATVEGLLEEGQRTHHATRRVDCERTAVKDELVVSADLIDKDDGKPQAFGARREQRAALGRFAERTENHGSRGYGSKNGNAALLQARLERIKALTARDSIAEQHDLLKLQREASQLVRAEAVNAVFCDIISTTRSVIGSIPDKIVSVLPARAPKSARGWSTLRRRVESESRRIVEESLHTIADRLSQSQ